MKRSSRSCNGPTGGSIKNRLNIAEGKSFLNTLFMAKNRKRPPKQDRGRPLLREASGGGGGGAAIQDAAGIGDVGSGRGSPSPAGSVEEGPDHSGEIPSREPRSTG